MAKFGEHHFLFSCVCSGTQLSLSLQVCLPLSGIVHNLSVVSNGLRLAGLVVPPGPDLSDLALPVQLLHLLVLGVRVPLAAVGQHPPSKRILILDVVYVNH